MEWAVDPANWAVPWTTSQVINFLFLLVATSVVTAVPVAYAVRANLRDPLARAVLAGTGATAIAFIATTLSLLGYHAGWNPPESVWDWITRITYLTVAFGKLLLLMALLKVQRERRFMGVRGRGSR